MKLVERQRSLSQKANASYLFLCAIVRYFTTPCGTDRLSHRISLKSVLLLVLMLGSLGVNAQTLGACSKKNGTYPNGQFLGPIQIQLLEDGRNVKVLKDVRYLDPCGNAWDIPAGSVTNGASIPQFAWSPIGGPFEGKYRDASFVHDVACDLKSRPWPLVHEVFYYAMLARGTAIWKAKVMYAAVYHFAQRWPDPKIGTPALPSRLRQEDFELLAKEIRNRESRIGAVDLPPMSLDEIEGWKPPVSQ